MPTVNHLIESLSVIIIIIILAGLVVWFCKEVLPLLLSSSAPKPDSEDPFALTENVSRQIARLDRYETITDEKLTDVYIAIKGLADTVKKLYRDYQKCTIEVEKLDTLITFFNVTQNGKTTLKPADRVTFLAESKRLADSGLQALISFEAGLQSPSYIERVYQALNNNRVILDERAASYEQIAIQLFDRIDNIRHIFSSVKEHIANMKASREVARIEKDLDDISRKLKIQGDKPNLPATVIDMKNNMPSAAGG